MPLLQLQSSGQAAHLWLWLADPPQSLTPKVVKAAFGAPEVVLFQLVR